MRTLSAVERLTALGFDLSKVKVYRPECKCEFRDSFLFIESDDPANLNQFVRRMSQFVLTVHQIDPRIEMIALHTPEDVLHEVPVPRILASRECQEYQASMQELQSLEEIMN